MSQRKCICQQQALKCNNVTAETLRCKNIKMLCFFHKNLTKYELYIAYAGIRLSVKFEFNIYSFDYIIINIKTQIKGKESKNSYRN